MHAEGRRFDSVQLHQISSTNGTKSWGVVMRHPFILETIMLRLLQTLINTIFISTWLLWIGMIVLVIFKAGVVGLGQMWLPLLGWFAYNLFVTMLAVAFASIRPGSTNMAYSSRRGYSSNAPFIHSGDGGDGGGCASDGC